MFRGVVVGLGNVSLNGHLPGWKKKSNFEMVAGVDPSPQQRELYQKQFPGGFCCATLEECEKINFDFVDVCTPPHTHFPIVKKALEKNLNVICEKPLVLAEKELKTLRDLSEKNQKVLFTVHNWKFAPILWKVTELLRQNAIGEIQSCSWYVLRNGPAITTLKDNWRLDPQKAGGGILIDHGWHAFYLILHWLGCDPGTVSAELENRQYEDLPVEDTAKIKLEFKDARQQTQTAELFLTWASRVRRNSGTIDGSHGSIQIEDDSIRLTKKNGSAKESVETFSFDQPLSQGSHHPDWFQGVADEFLSELTDDKKRGGNLKIAASCLALIERSKESHQKKSPVPFTK